MLICILSQRIKGNRGQDWGDFRVCKKEEVDMMAKLPRYAVLGSRAEKKVGLFCQGERSGPVIIRGFK